MSTHQFSAVRAGVIGVATRLILDWPPTIPRSPMRACVRWPSHICMSITTGTTTTLSWQPSSLETGTIGNHHAEPLFGMRSIMVVRLPLDTGWTLTGS
jgi:hypothetical protein